jgi:hypothetical protein
MNQQLSVWASLWQTDLRSGSMIYPYEKAVEIGPAAAK